MISSLALFLSLFLSVTSLYLSLQQLEEAQRAISRAQDECAEWQRKHGTAEAALAAARRDLEDGASKLSSNEQVIAFLNKEITESRLTGASTAAHFGGSMASSTFGQGAGSSALAFRPTVPVSAPTVREIPI